MLLNNNLQYTFKKFPLISDTEKDRLSFSGSHFVSTIHCEHSMRVMFSLALRCVLERRPRVAGSYTNKLLINYINMQYISFIIYITIIKPIASNGDFQKRSKLCRRTPKIHSSGTCCNKQASLQIETGGKESCTRLHSMVTAHSHHSEGHVQTEQAFDLINAIKTTNSQKNSSSQNPMTQSK